MKNVSKIFKIDAQYILSIYSVYTKYIPSIYYILLLLTFLVPRPTQGAPIPFQNIPQSLKPWIPWVLHDQEEEHCPFLHNDGEKICAWPSQLQLDLDKKSGNFRQSWQVFARSKIPLPGNEDHWPQAVKANGQAAIVLLESKQPVLELEAGTYHIEGQFHWDQLPESFPIPPETGILHLSVQGQTKSFPQVDLRGLVWLQKEQTKTTQENRLELKVYRKLTDDIPFTITTVMRLYVSGTPREEIFTTTLPSNFIPTELKSRLPARMDAQGKLHLQVKPGTWEIEWKARHQGPLTQLKMEKAKTPWPTEEVWVFESRPQFRLVWVKGAPTIDPAQTKLPTAWKGLPAYRMAPGTQLVLEEKRRGDSDPAPDQLSLHRDLWLDFNGKGFTIQDHITGKLSQSWRIEMNEPVELGRLALNGENQFITRLPGKKKRGVEIRQGKINVEADSRLPQRSKKLSAVGWDQDFQKLSTTLHLSPGWRLFSASGVDEASDTWIKRWTLLDLFLLFMTSLAFFKLWGAKWGFFTLVTLALSFPETHAPQWTWLAVATGLGILSLLPLGKIKNLMRLYKLGSIAALLIIALPFMVNQIKHGLYPSLEKLPGYVSQSFKTTKRLDPPKYEAPKAIDAAPTLQAKGGLVKAQEKKKIGSIKNPLRKGQAPSRFIADDRDIPLNLAQYRPGTQVQTGPGLPNWQWKRIKLGWNGPVMKSHELDLILLPPWFNLILAFLRVGLISLLLLKILGWSRQFWSQLSMTTQGRAPLAMGILILGISLGFSQPTLAKSVAILESNPKPAQSTLFPSPEILEELQERLLEDPPCSPQCATISRMQLHATPKTLRARLEVHVQAKSAVPLPGQANQWLPQEVSLNGQALAKVRKQDSEKRWLLLGKGVHQIVLQGPLPNRPTVQLALPLKPYFVETQLNGWALEGLKEDGQVEDTLQLTRTGTNAAPQTLDQAQDNGTSLPPLVVVERHLILDLNWEVRTRVLRRSPTGTPVVLSIPLLEGESVITPNTRVENGKVLVNMAPAVSQVSWRSDLKEASQINLEASAKNAYMEVWKLSAGALWHVDLKGIPKILPNQNTQASIPEWRPWPGEKLQLNVVKPQGVPGSTITIQENELKLSPGDRFTKIELNFQLRSSLGGQHIIELPSEAQLQKVIIDGKEQPIRLEQGKLTLPIGPRLQKIKIHWQMPQGIKTIFKSPKINLNVPSVNTKIIYRLPKGQWVLWTQGPRLGAAVLFWPLLIVLLLTAIILSRLKWTPLSLVSWLLLSIGVSQFPAWPYVALLFVAGWLLSLGWRRLTPNLKPWSFNLRQFAILAYTGLALTVLFFAIYEGLLGRPEMQIGGYGSYHNLLLWFQDRSDGVLPQPWVLSVPIFYYRIAMLAWALWLALALIKWLRWGWGSFGEGGLWKPLGIRRLG